MPCAREARARLRPRSVPRARPVYMSALRRDQVILVNETQSIWGESELPYGTMRCVLHGMPHACMCSCSMQSVIVGRRGENTRHTRARSARAAGWPSVRDRLPACAAEAVTAAEALDAAVRRPRRSWPSQRPSCLSGCVQPGVPHIRIGAAAAFAGAGAAAAFGGGALTDLGFDPDCDEAAPRNGLGAVGGAAVRRPRRSWPSQRPSCLSSFVQPGVPHGLGAAAAAGAAAAFGGGEFWADANCGAAALDDAPRLMGGAALFVLGAAAAGAAARRRPSRASPSHNPSCLSS